MINQASFTLRNRNLDMLTGSANLSNDEVFTPPEFVNRMLDTLAEAWATDNGGQKIPDSVLGAFERSNQVKWKGPETVENVVEC